MTVHVNFMTLSGAFATHHEADFASVSEATAAVEAYAAAAGYTRVKVVDDDDMDSLRWTARTPGGRSGRNVAFGDW